MSRWTPAQFDALFQVRGWTQAAVAERWGVTARRVSQIKFDSHRAPHWEDALWGLPERKKAHATDARRHQVVIALAREAAPTSTSDCNSDSDTPDLFYPEVGDEWTVRDSPGEHLPEGCAGMIASITLGTDGPEIAIRFDNGYTEVFTSRYLFGLECFLSATGRKRSLGP